MVAICWGLFISPKAAVRVPTAGWVLLQAALFGAAILGLGTIGRLGLAMIFGMVVLLNTMALYLLQR